jgi:hypothetical protein
MRVVKVILLMFTMFSAAIFCYNSEAPLRCPPLPLPNLIERENGRVFLYWSVPLCTFQFPVDF